MKYMMQLEKRFKRDDQFRNRYVSAMQEYFSLGHAVVAPKLSAGQPSYFIPHLAVIKESSLTIKTGLYLMRLLHPPIHCHSMII